MVDKRVNVLLIESEPAVLAAVHLAMASAASQGFSVRQMDTLEDGLEYLADHACDVILACLALPDIQGLSTIERLRARAPGVPVIVLAHDNDDSAAVGAVQAGAQDFVIHREIDHALPSAIRHAMERAALVEELRAARDELEMRVEERTRELRQKVEELHAARERMRGLSRRLVEVQEAERRHLARELHDEVGQLLTGMKLRLELCKRLPQDEAAELLDESQAALNELMKRVRELSLDLRPAVLDDLGLLAALNWHVERFRAQTGVRVDFVHAGVAGARFAAAVEIAAFRIVQEALTNVARHAGVAVAAVRVDADRDRLLVEIVDHGHGFDPAAALEVHTSSGVAGMAERALLLGGKLEIRSERGSGAAIRAELPLSGL
ncbi:MAG: response regulator [Blastocatellia bacterium]|nr:response regulator [Blastocatellia bacterium]